MRQTEHWFNDLKHLKQTARQNAPFAGYFLLGVAVSWFVFALVSLASPHLALISKGSNDTVLQGAFVMAHSAPTHITIPTLGVDARFEGSLGLDSAGSVEVPEGYTTVGWYEHSATPGELGPAVVLGHVDSWQGPAVFHDLWKLNPGDTIFIEREDGTTARFEVTRLRSPLREEFPTEDVYGAIDHAGLRLVTCAGFYDHGVLRYSHNLIVYARLVDSD